MDYLHLRGIELTEWTQEVFKVRWRLWSDVRGDIWWLQWKLESIELPWVDHEVIYETLEWNSWNIGSRMLEQQIYYYSGKLSEHYWNLESCSCFTVHWNQIQFSLSEMNRSTNSSSSYRTLLLSFTKRTCLWNPNSVFSLLQDQSHLMLFLSHVGDPRNAYLIYFPLTFICQKAAGIKVLWVAAVVEWLNAILKW